VQANYGSFGSENNLTGALFDRLSDTIVEDGWTIVVRQQQYSPNVKEPLLGADAGILVEIRDRDGNGVRKVAWLQAKKRDDDDPNLAKQLDDMRRRTADAYLIVYAADSTEVKGGPNLEETWSLDDWLDGVVECVRGDKALDVLLDTFDRKHLLTIAIAQTPATI